jgi:tRNA-2-methylthio-N6-dimethylallyladenosine synthase
MNRTYTREWYLARVRKIHEILPGCGISSDLITGFCSESAEDHQETLDLMEQSRYDFSYMFMYSERPGTLAAKRYKDDIPAEIKKTRLEEIVNLQNRLSLESNRRDIGNTYEILIEGNSKRSDSHWMGRTSHSKVVVFPKNDPSVKAGDYVKVRIEDCTQGTLLGITTA